MNDASILSLADFPTPANAARSGPLVGIDLVLADGQTWTLASHVPSFGLVWDRLYDDNLIVGCYQVADVMVAAARLLLANYDLPSDFAAWLLAGIDPPILVAAVETALFGRRDLIRSWSDWAESSLWANGIDPASIPPRMLRSVLDQLVATGRAMPSSHYTSAGIAAGKRQAIMDKFQQAGIKPLSPSPASEPS